jgi:YHS domain-containing protein
MFVRFILTMLLVFLGYTLLNAVLRLFMGTSSPGKAEDSVDQMVPCAHCGTYVPQSEAIRKKKHGKVYYLCDDKCLKEYKKNASG